MGCCFPRSQINDSFNVFNVSLDTTTKSTHQRVTILSRRRRGGGGKGLNGEITASVSDPKVLKLFYRTQVL